MCLDEKNVAFCSVDEPKLIPEQPDGGPRQPVRHLSLGVCLCVFAAVVDSLCVSLCNTSDDGGGSGPAAEEPSTLYLSPASSGC